MEEKAKKRRDWIKNATIVFLVIMLILTFFSNTIMNYSLPEVSAQYTTSGNVSSKVRGTAAVEAVEPYEIKVEESRTVEEVRIHAGDTIEEGQLLFVLGDSDGTALEEAEDAYDTANLEYQQKLLESSPDYSSNNLDIRFAKEDYKKAMADYRKGKADYKEWGTKVEALEKKKKTAQELVATYTQQKADYTRQKTKLQNQKPDVKEEAAAYKKAKDAYEDLEYAASLGANGGDYSVALAAARRAMDKAAAALETATAEKQALIDAQVESVSELLDTADKNLTDANEALTERSTELEEAKAQQKAISLSDLSKNIDSTKRAYEKLVADLEKTQHEDSSKESINNLQLQNMKKKLNRLEKKVERLKESGATNELKSKVAGVVSSVNCVAGDKTTPDAALAVIELTDRGYRAKLSITNEQSQQIREGSVAEILNIWGEDVTATVTSIKNDMDNPGKKRLVTFTITGNVSVGQSLDLSIGDKSSFYDTIVPNSAIHEDNKGKFILSIQAKSSPLGTRYIATRVDVEVLAADETSSAISGSTSGSEFIITTSTKPIEPGMQVRLIEGGDSW